MASRHRHHRAICGPRGTTASGPALGRTGSGVVLNVRPQPKAMKERVVIILLLLVAAIALVVVVRRHSTSGGIDVTVLNRGPGTITDVEVQLKGHVYPLGKFAPGGSGQGRLTPVDESGVAVEFRDGDGVWHRVEAAVALKRGYRGKVTVEIERNTLARVEQHVGPE